MINGINLDHFMIMMILQKNWLSECKRILKQNGTIWVIEQLPQYFSYRLLSSRIKFLDT